MERVHAIRSGDDIHVGDRPLTAVAPPLFDNPMSIGVLDRSTGALFTVDACGALLPEATQDASDVAPEALAGGMIGWATSDSPWVHMTDPAEFGQILDRVRQVQPRQIFSSHLPAASGTALEEIRGRGRLPARPRTQPGQPPPPCQDCRGAVHSTCPLAWMLYDPQAPLDAASRAAQPSGYSGSSRTTPRPPRARRACCRCRHAPLRLVRRWAA